MGSYTVIVASEEQVQSFYEKHMKSSIESSMFRLVKKLTSPLLTSTIGYSYDDEDSIGFFSIKTNTGKRISCQVRRGEPMFVELTGFGNIRYDVYYPSKSSCKEFYTELKELCAKAEKDFWAGAHL